MPNYPNYGGINFNPYSYYNPPFVQQPTQPQIQPQQMQRPSDGRTYVNGRAGADAFPLPVGVNQIILWDTEAPRFYVKGYDDNGMPRVLEDKDYSDHVEPTQKSEQTMDTSKFVTQDDFLKFVDGLVTKDYVDKALSELSVGNGGRIVRVNESNG